MCTHGCIFDDVVSLLAGSHSLETSLPLRNYPSFPQPHREWQLWVNAGGLQMPQSEVDDPLTRRGSQMNELALQNE